MERDLGVPETGLPAQIDEFASGARAVSDNSEFSWFAPFAMAWIAAGPPDIGWHNWQVTDLVKGSVGHKAMVTTAKVLAASAVELLNRPGILDAARAELAQQISGGSYRSLIPPDVAPPVDINRKTTEKYRRKKGRNPKSPRLRATKRIYHGRMRLAMTMTSKVKPYRLSFGPFAPEVYRMPFRDEVGPEKLKDFFIRNVRP